jgi:hypothetical protein
MSLVKTFEETRKSLAWTRATKAYAEGRARQGVLAPYDSVLAVLRAAAATSSLTTEGRDALLVGVLTELRSTKHSLWLSVLVLAFEPLIVRVRSRLGPQRPGRPQSDDLDQRVFLAFLEAAHALRVESHAARMLRLAFQRRVFGDKSAEVEPEMAEFVDDTYCADPFGVGVAEKAAALEVVRIIEAAGGEELRDVMLATRANDETLRAYVERAYAERSAAERESAYYRLVTTRKRAESQLRAQARRPTQRRTNAA